MLTRKHAYYGIMILFSALFLCMLELFSYLYLNSGLSAISPSPRQIVDDLDPDQVKRFYRTTFDRRLGWQPRANASGQGKNSAGVVWRWTTDRYGARTNLNFGASESPYIATFGDSFTFGDEVNDDETWQHYLSGMLDANVANYGVGGYGTDQALLRFREKLDEGLRPRIAVLGIFEDNFKRVLNRFRPFYSQRTGLVLGFKPRADVTDSGRLVFLDSPLTRPVYDRESILKAVEAARDRDYWAGLPRFEFPYLVNLWRQARLDFCIDHPSVPTCGMATGTVSWEDPRVRSIMSALILEFARTCESRGIEPVILLITVNKVAEYRSFMAAFRKQNAIPNLRIVDVGEIPAWDPPRFRITATNGHLSAYGNRVLAEYIRRELFPRRERRQVSR